MRQQDEQGRKGRHIKNEHDELVEYAAKWLHREHSVVVTEMATLGEEADAIGFRRCTTTVVECKTSRADFLLDRKKSFRRWPERGMGNRRYYLCPAGMITIDDLPDRWGLLEVHAGKVRCILEARSQPKNAYHEIAVLVSTVRRIGQTVPDGVSVKCYTYETQNRATMGVAEL